MIHDYHFRDIEKYLKKDSEVGADILDTFESLSDAAIIFSPILIGPEMLPLLEILDVKDRLFQLGRKVYNAIIGRVEVNYLARMEQLKAAYALICYTAYFDVLEDALPREFRKKFKQKLKSRIKSTEDLGDSAAVQQQFQTDVCGKVYYADHVTSFTDIKVQLGQIYEAITERVRGVIDDSFFYEKGNHKEKIDMEQFAQILDGVSEKALAAYEAQYLALADQFNDFALFTQIKNFDCLHHALKQNQQALTLLGDVTKNLDIGLNRLSDIVNSISTNFGNNQVQNIITDLKRIYQAALKEPIIDTQEIASKTEQIELRFPKIKDAFIPQDYKCLIYNDRELSLEKDSVWKALPRRNDLDKFFIQYLYSPNSIEYPLIILGEPGSGKSLLTKVLSAQLMSNSYTVIRIPLREVDAQASIDILVEDQIKTLISRPLSLEGYGGFASQFNERPLIIILDGYDELLQARGDVFSGYLESARRFQNDQLSLGRPVRIIITSRHTLIDKARVPSNSTILRLMEFDQKQRQMWSDIWNKTNANYFAQSKVRPFCLPIQETGKRNAVLELAKQPLLLLMLALYDSERNELAQANDIKRTEIYDNLIRRFVRRERSRYIPRFADKTVNEQEIIVDEEMNRLGVVAIGMYNRRDVKILATQLERDLDILQAHRTDTGLKAHTLKESVSVIGSFFFINKSTARKADARSNQTESAYEFLHNTFGEFLAADFILRNILQETASIYINRKFKSLNLESKLTNPDLLSANWFYCLMFVPLYSRPVVVEMLREHREKGLERFLEIRQELVGFTKGDFDENLRFIIQNQLKMILETKKMPSVMCGGVQFDQDIPLLGHLAAYSVNLVILASAFNAEGFEFCESEFHVPEIVNLTPELGDKDDTNEITEKCYESTLKPWDRLVSLWKVWFSSFDIVGLSVILTATRRNSTTVHIKCHEKFTSISYDDPVDILLCASHTLADNLLMGLSGLQTPHFAKITGMRSQSISNLLETEDLNLYFQYQLTLLRKEIVGTISITDSKGPEQLKKRYKSINKIIISMMKHTRISAANDDILLSVFEIIDYCLCRNMLFSSTRMEIQRSFKDLVNRLKIIPKSEPSLLNWTTCEMGVEVPFDQTSTTGAFTTGVLDNLMSTNPTIATQAILDTPKQYCDEYEKYLSKGLKELSAVGPDYFGYDAIINLISIAECIRAEPYLEQIKDLLNCYLFQPNNQFKHTIRSNPAFISELIDKMPKLFTNSSLSEFTEFSSEEIFHPINPKKSLDYIKMFRGFYSLNNLEYNFLHFVGRCMFILNDVIIDSKFLGKVNLDQITIGQLDDLQWYADIMPDKSLARDMTYLYWKFEKRRKGENKECFDRELRNIWERFVEY